MYTARAKTIDVIQNNLTYLENPGPGKYNEV